MEPEKTPLEERIMIAGFPAFFKGAGRLLLSRGIIEITGSIPTSRGLRSSFGGLKRETFRPSGKIFPLQ